MRKVGHRRRLRAMLLEAGIAMHIKEHETMMDKLMELRDVREQEK